MKVEYKSQLGLFPNKETLCKNYLPSDIFSSSNVPMTLIGGPGGQDQYYSFLANTASKSREVRGCVAYWTIGQSTIPDLFELLKSEDSFICVDPSPPTELNMLKTYHEKGYNFWAFGYFIRNFETKDGLLHSKILLFDIDDGNAILVIGSHNMTNRALFGINIEHSIAIPLDRSSDTYEKVDSHLRCIKSQYCIPPWSREEKEEEVLVLKIIGENMDQLVSERIITVFFNMISDGIKTTGTKLYILALDVNSKEEYLYLSQVHQAGELNKRIEKSIGLEFSSRRIAETEPFFIPFLYQEKAVNRELIEREGYFNSFEIIKKVDSYKVFDSAKGNKSFYNVANEMYPLVPKIDGESLKVFRYEDYGNNTSYSFKNSIDTDKYTAFYSKGYNDRNPKDKSLKDLKQKSRKIATKKIIRFL